MRRGATGLDDFVMLERHPVRVAFFCGASPERVWLDTVESEKTVNGLGGIVPRTTVIANDNASSCPAERNRCAEAGGTSTDDGNIEVAAAFFRHSDGIYP